MNDRSNRSFPRGDSVPFPYEKRYSQQVDLMDTILESLQARQLRGSDENGASLWMLESPTGTGKSLSLAAATLAWLDYQERDDLQIVKRHEVKDEEGTTQKVNWVDAWESPQERDIRDNQNRVRQCARENREKLAAYLDGLRRKQRPGNRRLERQRVLRESLMSLDGLSKKRPKVKHQKDFVKSNDDLLLNEYKSDEEHGSKMVLAYEDSDDEDYHRTPRIGNPALQRANPLELLQGSLLDGSLAALPPFLTTAVGEVRPGSGVRKIIYAARTHSQLSQFAREVQRIPVLGETVRLVALGGRTALCGYDALRQKYKQDERDLTEACLDLQKGSGGSKRKSNTHTSAGSGCPLLSSREAVATLALHFLTQPTEIEEAASLGQSSQVCAYYATRKSIAASQVIVLPYSMLLSTGTREAIGLSLQSSLVIVDEAHNLPEALRAIHSAQLSLPVVKASMEQARRYVEKYKDRLAGRNLFYLGQLQKTLVSFQKQMQKLCPQRREPIISVEAFLLKLKLQNTNFFKLLRYLETSRLSQKLLGFMNHQECITKEEGGESKVGHFSKHISPMSVVETFLQKLTSTEEEGKIVMEYASKTNTPVFRFVLLDPASFLAPVLKEAHAVALVGGTLRPFGHVASELLVDTHIQRLAQGTDVVLKDSPVTSGSFKKIGSRFTAFTCGHVVPPERVFLQCLSRGPSGKRLDFRHAHREEDEMMGEMGQILIRVIKSVSRGGIVVFLSSYSYETQLVQFWKQQGIWHDMQKLTSIFREPASSRDVERTLKDYSVRATTSGALLLSVIGGKMSEGINFADDMARCVVVVGLPYPDITDPELQEKMSGLDRSAHTGMSGKSYYHNLCMRAVNQSVGRAIRHANDYAAILLVDERYSTDSRVWQALPSWLTNHNKSTSMSFHEGEQALHRFFDRFTPCTIQRFGTQSEQC